MVNMLVNPSGLLSLSCSTALDAPESSHAKITPATCQLCHHTLRSEFINTLPESVRVQRVTVFQHSQLFHFILTTPNCSTICCKNKTENM